MFSPPPHIILASLLPSVLDSTTRVLKIQHLVDYQAAGKTTAEPEELLQPMRQAGCAALTMTSLTVCIHDTANITTRSRTYLSLLSSLPR